MKAATIALGLLTASCSTSLRAPLCKPGEFELPAGAAGRYRLATVTTNAQWAASLTSLSEIEFAVRESTDSFEFGASQSSASALGRLLARAGQGGAMKAADEGDGAGDAVMPLAVCKIGQTYYSQSREDDGTYQLSRFDLSPTGITTTSLVFDPDELAKAGFKAIFVPKFSEVSDEGKWSFNEPDATRMIVDTEGLGDGGRERLMQLAHPTVVGMVFSRVERPKELHGEARETRTWRVPRR